MVVQKILPNTSDLLKRFTGRSVFEIRALCSDNGYSKVLSAIDDSWSSWDNIKEAVMFANEQGNVFFTLNPLKQDCRAKAQFGRLSRVKSGEGVTDGEVLHRRWFLIDLDPERLKNVSSTDEEKAFAWEKAEQIRAFMEEKGFHKPVVCDSGNGYHLLYRISMPNDREHADLLRDALLLLDEKFSDEHVKVDRKVFNAARIVKLYGTIARKGRNDRESGRIHRKSGFVEFPDMAEDLVNLDSLFYNIVGDVKKEEKTCSYGGSQEESIKFVRDFLQEHGLAYREEDKSGDIYFFLKDGCVFNPDHAGKDAAIIVPKSGKRVYKCFHDSCEGNHWKDFVKMFEPDYKTFEERAAEDCNILDSAFGSESATVDEGPDTEKSNKNGPESVDSEKPSVSSMLDRNSKGKIQKTVHNLLTILRHDPKLKRLIGYDELSRMPVNMKTDEWWTDADDARVFAYIQRMYFDIGSDMFKKALTIRMDETKFNPVTKILDKLVWDGRPRIETALTDYLGAKDDAYTRHVSKLMFISAIARTYKPGIKYDLMPVLVGGQGCGKSTFCSRMALEEKFFTDAIRGIGSKEAIEQLLGSWIVEWGEMSAMKRAKDAEIVKLFVSQTRDKFRPAFGVRVVNQPRYCIFVGTTNDVSALLTDSTGNRRFLPVHVSETSATKSLWADDVKDEFRQMMAEAKTAWGQGFSLVIPDELTPALDKAREAVFDIDPDEGVIIHWLQCNPEIDYICTKTIWAEALGHAMNDALPKAESHRINRILEHCGVVERSGNRIMGEYGKQRSWKVLRERITAEYA